MGVRQLINSVGRILSNRQINRGYGLAKHLEWQGRKILNGFPFEQEISRSRIIASHRQCGVSALINSQGMYDYNNMHLIQLLLRGGDVFMDIGANIGSFTLIASEVEGARIHAFEPHPGTFELLRRNVELNQRSNVTLHNVALSSSDGEVRMTDRRGSSINHIVVGGGQSIDTVAVPSVRMDRLCHAKKIAPRIVKLDVEGFEFDVLTGFGELLSSVQVLLIEMNGLSDQRSHGQQEIHALLTSKGFSGPWMCVFDKRKMFPAHQRGSEDSLYVSDTFLGEDGAKAGLEFVKAAES